MKVKMKYILALLILSSVFLSCNNKVTLNTEITSSSSVSIGGYVVGLTSGENISLRLNGSETIVVNYSTGNDFFKFGTTLSTGQSYYVELTVPTPLKTCTPGGNSGTAGSSDVFSIIVNCTGASSAGVTVSPTLGLTTSENGSSSMFAVWLNAPPTANVIIDLASLNTSEVTVGPASLTFTPANYKTPQFVTLTGKDELLFNTVDGPQMVTITPTVNAASATEYLTTVPSTVSVVNADNDAAGISISAKSIFTSENGGVQTFTVVLNTPPTAGVSFNVTSSNINEIKLSSDNITYGASVPVVAFTTLNWNVPQTIFVKGIDDVIVDGDIALNLNFSAITSTDVNYSAIVLPAIPSTNFDNDGGGVPGIHVTPATGLFTTETGLSASVQFGVVLQSKPTANVVLPISSSLPAEGTPSVASLTFTPANWNTPQVVSVTSVSESVADGNQAYSIVIGGDTTTTDTNYNVVSKPAMNPVDVAITSIDNDTAGISISAKSIFTSENGGVQTFTVVLNTQPTAGVSFDISSPNVNEIKLSPDGTTYGALIPITFTTANWNIPQTIFVQGIDDVVVDGDVALNLNFSAITSTDVNYSALVLAAIPSTNFDNDTGIPGIHVTPSSGLVTTETGLSASVQFGVVLQSKPTANVVLPISSSLPTEGTPSVVSLTFTPANWNTPQVVTVTSVPENVADANQPYSIIIGGDSTTTDVNYNVVSNPAMNPVDVAITSIDDDTAGVYITPTTGLMVTEGLGSGHTNTFTVRLTSAPLSLTSVTIPISSSLLAEGTVLPASLVFDNTNWNTPQTVTVTGVDESKADGNQPFTIVTGNAASADPSYNNMVIPDVPFINLDNDQAKITVSMASPSTLMTTESGGTANFSVVLNTQPTATVTMTVTRSALAEVLLTGPTFASVTSGTLTFTTANWNTPQTVTITGQDDAVMDGNTNYTIDFGIPAGDATYTALGAPASISVINADNDMKGITVNTGSGLITTEAGGTASFTVVLNSRPTADVIIGSGTVMSSSVPSEVIITSPTTLTFSSTIGACPGGGDWCTPQTVTLQGADDLLTDGKKTSTINWGVISSADAAYNNYPLAALTAHNLDNETTPKILFTTPTTVTTSESGTTARVGIMLGSQLTCGSVTLGPITSLDTTEGTITTPAGITFTSTNWYIPQIIEIKGVADGIIDGNITFNISFGSTSGCTDAAWNGLTPPNATVTNNDYTVATYWVSRPAGSYWRLYGTSVPFTVYDDSFANVPIGFTFNYFGTNYTTIDVGTNGLASFHYGLTASLSNSQLYALVASPNRVIAPWWDDLGVNPSGAMAGQVTYLTQGVAPNRTFTIDWNTVYLFADFAQQYSFQIILYETTNVIDLVYGPSSPTSFNASASMGLSDNTGVYRDAFTGLDSGYVPGVNDNRKYSDFPTANTVIRFTP